jgi:hypothetical protein
MKRYGYIWVFAILILAGCNEFQQAVKEAKQESIPPPKDNYIVLLDLSDRILFNNQQQVSKDLTVVSSIYEVFKAGIKTKDPTRLYYTVNDKLKVLIAPQKTTPKQLYEMVGGLRVELGNEPPDKKAAALDSLEKAINTQLPLIYKQAVISNNSAAYSGADIWRYFDEDLLGDLEKDANNTLFIITDGYMNFENTEQRMARDNRFTSCAQVINALKKYPDWNTRFDSANYGLLPTEKNFANLKVVLLQINPKPDWSGEYSLLTKIWSKWFNEMGITSYHFIKEENINEIRESMEKFMQVKMSAKVDLIPWVPITDRQVTNVYTKDNTTTTITFSTVSANTAAVPMVGALPQRKWSTHKEHMPANQIQQNASSEAPLHDEKEEDVATGPQKPSVPISPRSSKAKKEDDILNDSDPTKGFNTGIKKRTKNN